MRDTSGISKGIKYNLTINEWRCNFCKGPDEESCKEMDGETGYGCTRKLGHRGDHIACGAEEDDHYIHRWKT